MTVKLRIGRKYEYVGVSTDVKPTNGPIGSEFTERDTGLKYIWDGTAWGVLTTGVGVIPAGDNNIGNVDIVTVPAPLNIVGGGTEAAAQRVTIANDSTGVLSVDDNGGSLTVDNPTLGATNGAAVITDADGTIQQYLRGLIKLFASIWDSTNNWLNVKVKPVLVAPALHRSAIAAVDKVANAVAATATSANVAGTQGTLLANTLYYLEVIPGNRWGPTAVNVADQTTTPNDAANTHVIAYTIAAVPGAEWYDLFLSTAAAPLYVGRITEQQRATGGEILTVGVYTAGASAGVINIGIIGTGVATSAAQYVQSNAYTPASVAAIDCTGYSKAIIYVKLALTDLRSAPTLKLIPFTRNETSTGDWHHDSIMTMALLGATGQTLEQKFILDVLAETNLNILVDTISGQGATATVWVGLER